MSRNYSSTAVDTTLTGSLTDTATSMTVAATTGFPSVPFVVAIDAGASTQELVLVTGVASTTLTITRGYDSTVAQSHLIGATVQHSHAAIDFREAATHIDATTSVHGVTGSVVGTGGTQTLTNKTLVSPVASGSLASWGGAWTAYTPTWTASSVNPTIGNGSIEGKYTQIGKTVHYVIEINYGSTTSSGTGTWLFGTPTNMATSAGNYPLGDVIFFTGSTFPATAVAQRSTADAFRLVSSAGGLVTAATHPMASGGYIVISGTYEAA